MADTKDLKSFDENREGSTPSSGTLYRYTEYLRESGVSIYRQDFEIIKRTPCGVWIRFGYEVKRFVNLHAKNKFACETPEEALISFRARKKRQISILKTKLEMAEAALLAEPGGSKSYLIY